MPLPLVAVQKSLNNAMPRPPLRYHSAFFIKSATNYRQLPSDSGAEVAFLGRSNAGKSSAINCLTRKGLARTSKTPGRTQQINVFGVDKEANYRLIDLPGYGFAHAPKAVRSQWPTMTNDYLTHRDSLRGLVLVVDSRHPLKQSDTHLLSWCKQANLPVHILATKVDKLSRNAAQAAHYQLQQLVGITSETKASSTAVSLQLFSAKSHQGLEQLQDHLTQWLCGDLGAVAHV